MRMEKRVEVYLREMPHKNMVPNTVTYSSLIDGLCKSGRITSALDLMKEMHHKGQPADVVTYNSLLDGLCKNQNLEKANCNSKEISLGWQL